MKKLNRNWPWIIVFLLPIVVLYSAFFIYPLVFVFITSLMEWSGIGGMEFTGLNNYITLFSSSKFQIAIKNNFIWALAGGFIQVPISTAIALILARRPKGWKFFRTSYFLPNVISAVALAMMWKAMYNAEYGAINSLLDMIGLHGWTHNWLGEISTALPAVILEKNIYIGYFMIIILAGTMNIPESLYEASRIDGASVWQQEIYITIPMVKGIIVTAMTLSMAYGLRQFEETFLLTSGGPANSTNVMGLHLYNKMDALKYGEANATGVVLIILGTFVIVAIQRIFGTSDANEVKQ
ncbi:MAG: carbohydrate ABC transporter permease [Spirochaetia bacterium]